MNKKIIVTLLSALCITSLVGCSKNTSNSSGSSSSSSSSSSDTSSGSASSSSEIEVDEAVAKQAFLNGKSRTIYDDKSFTYSYKQSVYGYELETHDVLYDANAEERIGYDASGHRAFSLYSESENPTVVNRTKVYPNSENEKESYRYGDKIKTDTDDYYVADGLYHRSVNHYKSYKDKLTSLIDEYLEEDADSLDALEENSELVEKYRAFKEFYEQRDTIIFENSYDYEFTMNASNHYIFSYIILEEYGLADQEEPYYYKTSLSVEYDEQHIYKISASREQQDWYEYDKIDKTITISYSFDEEAFNNIYKPDGVSVREKTTKSKVNFYMYGKKFHSLELDPGSEITVDQLKENLLNYQGVVVSGIFTDSLFTVAYEGSEVLQDDELNLYVQGTPGEGKAFIYNCHHRINTTTNYPFTAEDEALIMKLMHLTTTTNNFNKERTKSTFEIVSTSSGKYNLSLNYNDDSYLFCDEVYLGSAKINDSSISIVSGSAYQLNYYVYIYDLKVGGGVPSAFEASKYAVNDYETDNYYFIPLGKTNTASNGCFTLSADEWVSKNVVITKHDTKGGEATETLVKNTDYYVSVYANDGKTPISLKEDGTYDVPEDCEIVYVQINFSKAYGYFLYLTL